MTTPTTAPAPHPIADIICAWANGFRVEFRYRHHNPGIPEEIYLSDERWHLCGKAYSAWSGINEHRIHADDLAAWEAFKRPDITAATSMTAGELAELDAWACDDCSGDGWTWQPRQVAERATDVQEFKIDCETCGGTGWQGPDAEKAAAQARQTAQAHHPAQGLDELAAFETWFQQRRLKTWREAGCDKDRGPEPSENWSMGMRSELLEGWQARAALAQAPAADGWVATSERLPAIGERVWIAAWAWNNPDGARIYGVAIYDGKAWGNPEDPEQSATWWPPTHWMPMTTPDA